MPVVPPGIPSDGSWSVWFVPTIATTTAPKIATEINAAGSVDGSCLLVKGGIGLENSYEKYKDERLCTVQVFEMNGTLTWSVSDLEFVIDPQNASSPTNKLYALVTAAGDSGWDGYIVIRMGVPVDTALTTTHKVWVIPVNIGAPVPLPPEANSMLRAKSSVAVTGSVRRDVTPAT